MCDYSLHHVASRPARIGDVLVTTSFPVTCTRGLAAVDQPSVAVCLMPGTELAFEDQVKWDQPFSLFRRKEKLGNLVRFCQVNTDNPHAHHDAVEFPNGKIVLVTKLRKGQKARVVQMPAKPRPGEAAVGPTIDVVPIRIDSAV